MLAFAWYHFFFGLITIDNDSSIIRLVHYTTQEYVVRTREGWFYNAHTEIAKPCVTCLSFGVFEAGYCPTGDSLRTRLRTTVLYGYAAENWGYHARYSLIEGNILIFVLIQNVSKVSACSQAMVYKGSEYTFQQATKMTGLHLAAYFGLERTTSKLLERNAVVDSQDKDGRTPLSWAARDGDNVVVELLLENKSETESSDSEYTQTLPSGR
jgi:hypothetical protein